MKQAVQAEHWTPRMRMWLWFLGTIVCIPALIAVPFQLARITEIPLIVVFAPAVLLGSVIPGASHWLAAYVLMPLQCLVYGGLLGLSEVRGNRRRVAITLGVIHAILAIAAVIWTGGVIPNTVAGN